MKKSDFPKAISDFLTIYLPNQRNFSQKIIRISFKRKNAPVISYLNAAEVKLLLSQPDVKGKAGRRDLALLLLLYDTGARVQEIAEGIFTESFQRKFQKNLKRLTTKS